MKDLVISSSIQGYGFAESVQQEMVLFQRNLNNPTSHTKVHERNLSKYSQRLTSLIQHN